MRRLLAAGILYLIGIAIVLTIKPTLMFTEDGLWKEFGIGRNPKTHTWMPLWLFAVLWALVTYIVVTVALSIFGPSEPTEYVPSPTSKKKRVPILEDDVVDIDAEDLRRATTRSRKTKASTEMPEGYYILDRKATDDAGGVPKYVYLGKGLPEE